MILAGILCLVVAGWLSWDRFFEKTAPLASEASVRLNFSGNTNANTKAVAKSRSLEELNKILFQVKEDWKHLKDTRFFFEDYADEVVANFTLEEIRLLGFERTGHDFTNVVGFHYAIMRRWGELDYDGARVRLNEMIEHYRNARKKAYYLSLTKEDQKVFRPSGLSEGEAKAEPLVFSEIELAALQRLRKVESGHGVPSDYLGDFHRDLLEQLNFGRAKTDPMKVISEIQERNRERKKKVGEEYIGESYRNFGILKAAFENLSEQTPEVARSMLDDRKSLKLISPHWKNVTTGKGSESVNVIPLVQGYFLGLPDNTDWLKAYESLESDFQEDSLGPMLARWMEEDLEASLSWLHSQVLPARWYYKQYEEDPFSDFEFSRSQPVDAHSLLKGLAAGYWFRREPEAAENWISQNIQDLAPEFFEGALTQLSFISESPTGFLAILRKVQHVEDIQSRGRVIEGLEQQIDFFSSYYPNRYEWRQEVRILDELKTIEVAPNHRKGVDQIIERAERAIEENGGIEKD